VKSVLLALCLLLPAAAQINGTPTAVIGWNPNDPANNADGRPAILTHLGFVWNAILAPNGRVVFAEGARIRQIAADGTVRTLLTDSRLTNFTKLAADSLGDIYYITETEIDKLAPDGSTVKIAGNGTAGTAGEGGPATAAELQFPLDLGFDAAGDLLLNDGSRILRIQPNGTLVRVGGAVNASAAAFDSVGDVYFTGGFDLSRMTPDGAVTVIAGSASSGFSNGCASAANPAVGDAKTAGFNDIVGLAVDGAGNVLVADRYTTSRLRQVTPAGQILTLAGAPPSFGGDGGPASAALLDSPRGLAFDSAGAQ
jgi:hypothetical protein